MYEAIRPNLRRTLVVVVSSLSPAPPVRSSSFSGGGVRTEKLTVGPLYVRTLPSQQSL